MVPPPVASDASDVPRTIFVIRHGEKPNGLPQASGIDIKGNPDGHSLIPRGWQRAGAIARLFARRTGQLPAPTQLIAPDYGNGDNHRTHQTIQPLALLLLVSIECPYAVGDEAKLARKVAAATTGVTLICWEHQCIPDIAVNIPVPAGTQIPTKWPDDRFDMTWAFALDPSTQRYTFSQIPQLLLFLDVANPIPVDGTPG